MSNDSGSTAKGLEALMNQQMDRGWTPCAVVFSQRLSTDGRLIFTAAFTEYADPEAKSRVMEALKLRSVPPLSEE